MGGEGHSKGFRVSKNIRLRTQGFSIDCDFSLLLRVRRGWFWFALFIVVRLPLRFFLVCCLPRSEFREKGHLADNFGPCAVFKAGTHG